MERLMKLMASLSRKSLLSTLNEDELQELQKNFSAEYYHTQHRDTHDKCERVKRHTLEVERQYKLFLFERLNTNYAERLLKDGYKD